jgi:AcrR family transcriptional regulator
MAQVKKPGLRDAILAASFDLFCRRGYAATSMTDIAKMAGTTVSNLYNYFDSKLTILYEIKTPWLLDQVRILADEVQKFRTPESKLRRILIGVWSDIPQADHGFANALIEAIAVSDSSSDQGRLREKATLLLGEAEELLTRMMLEALPDNRKHLAEGNLLSHIIWMAFDGFVVSQKAVQRDIDAIADLMIKLLLGENT